MNKEKEPITPDFNIDFGNVELPEFDSDIFDFIDYEEKEDRVVPEEGRYTKPKVYKVKQHSVMYDNAEKLARELTVNKDERANVIVAGSFIFGDFLEAYIMQRNAKVKKMTINTLSISQENIDSLRTLLTKNYIDELNVIISEYFFAHERRALIPYMYKNLDIDNKFQLAVAATHMKTTHFETLGGRKIVIHGSANLRSSANLEQFTIEENEGLYNFYEEVNNKILDKYATIRKPIRASNLWDTVTRMNFND